MLFQATASILSTSLSPMLIWPFSLCIIGGAASYVMYRKGLSYGHQLKEDAVNEAKKASEAHLALVLQGAELGFWEWNIKTGLFFVNERWANMIGYHLKDLDLHISTWTQLIVPEDVAKFERKRQNHLDGKTDFFEVEHRLKHRNGYPIWVLVRGKVVSRDEQGYPISMAGTTMDIMDRRIVSDALARSERRLQNLFDGIDDAIFVFDPEGEILDCNKACQNLLGYKRPELLKMHCHDIEAPEYKDICKERLKTQIHSNRVFFESEYIKANGERLYVEANITAIEYGSGKAILCVARDITDNKETKAALKNSEEKYSLIINNVIEGIAMLNPAGIITFINPMGAKLLSNENQELVGKSYFDLVHESSLSNARTCFSHHLRGEAVSYDIQLKNPYSQPSWIRISATPVSKSQFSGILFMINDITERKHTEEVLKKSRQETEKMNSELKRAVDKAQQMTVEAQIANQSKTNFLTNMSHELRTPLNSIVGLSSLMFDSKELPDDHHDSIRTIQTSAESLLKIINDILDYSVMDSGHLMLNKEVFDLNESIEQLRISIGSKVRAKNLIFDVVLDPKLPHKVISDWSRIRQILTNVLENAVKFTTHGYVNLHIEVTKDHLPTDALLFQIKDSGIGIPLEVQPRIFDAFTQADESITRRFGGTGLGLAIVKRLIQLLDGDIKVVSSLQQGTLVSIWIPFEPIETSAHPSVIFQDQRLETQPDEAFALLKAERQKIKQSILLVEDNLINQKVAVKILEKLGYTTAVAGNGKLALEALRKAHFDLVLMDVQMPEMDGMEATRQIRQLDSGVRNNAIPIIALTAHAMKGDREKCLDCGMDDYLSKPIQPTRLSEMILQWIDRSSSNVYS
jgi:PAS domain S-box-containing protein